jgi:hypothetical protein
VVIERRGRHDWVPILTSVRSTIAKKDPRSDDGALFVDVDQFLSITIGPVAPGAVLRGRVADQLGRTFTTIGRMTRRPAAKR